MPKKKKQGKKQNSEKVFDEKKDDMYINKNSRVDNLAIIISLFIIGITPGLYWFTSYPLENWNLQLYAVQASSLKNYIANFEFPYINPDLSFGEYNAYYPLTFIFAGIASLLTKSDIFMGFNFARMAISLISALFLFMICRYEGMEKKNSIILTFMYSFTAWFTPLLGGSISFAGTFMFVPSALYSFYRVFNERNVKFEIMLVFSLVLLLLTSFGPLLYIFYFFIIYMFYLRLVEKRKLSEIGEGINRLVIPFLFFIGIGSFYLFFLVGINDSIAWNKILVHTQYSASRESFIKTGINPLSIIYGPKDGTTIGFVPFALFLISIYLKKNNMFSQFDKYLVMMTFLSVIASVFPMVFAYLPFVGHTEYGHRALPLAFFSIILLCRDAINHLRTKMPYLILLVIVVSGVLGQTYLNPNLYRNPDPNYRDIKDFYTYMDLKNVTRINYYVFALYPLCNNCLGFGAPVNYYGIVLDEPTTRLWGYIDYAQRNPTDPKISGLLGESYVITTKEIAEQDIKNGYKLVKEGEKLTLLENPNASSVFQFVAGDYTQDIPVQRKGSTFYGSFDAPSEGILLVKFTYHPLAELTDNGEKLKTEEETGIGIMYSRVKKGHHELSFRYGSYGYWYISAASLILFVYYYRRRLYG